MPDSPSSPSSLYKDPEALAWHCIQTKPKCEHLAAAHLRSADDKEIEIFCPRIRFKRNTRRGKVWFHEALFPCYLFVRFRPQIHHRTVLYANAVTKIVQFGNKTPAIPDDVIEALRTEVGEDELAEIPPDLEIGDEGVLGEGPLTGLTGVVHTLLTGEDRVRVLLEFLGRDTFAEVNLRSVSTQGAPRELLERSESSGSRG